VKSKKKYGMIKNESGKEPQVGLDATVSHSPDLDLLSKSVLFPAKVAKASEIASRLT
jgi:hypothetical protein